LTCPLSGSTAPGISYFDSSVIVRYAIGHELAVRSLAAKWDAPVAASGCYLGATFDMNVATAGLENYLDIIMLG